MFPRCLAEGPFSLRAGQACAALSLGIIVAPDGSFDPGEDVLLAPTTVTPTQRLTYDAVDEMLAYCEEGDEPDLFALLRVRAWWLWLWWWGGWWCCCCCWCCSCGCCWRWGSDACARLGGPLQPVLGGVSGRRVVDPVVEPPCVWVGTQRPLLPAPSSPPAPCPLQVAEARRARRLGAGATEIDMPEAKLRVEGAEGDAAEVGIEPLHSFASASRQLVAEMMIMAGEAAGLLGERRCFCCRCCCERVMCQGDSTPKKWRCF